MKAETRNVEYAIVDIETTGGSARGSKITEIAIRIHDGQQVIDRWESLVHPGQSIPPAIQVLTGINHEMVADAPTFDDIARKVYALLEGRVFVAHHVNFDASFIKAQLADAGYRWSPRKLCTVRMARKICPGLPSYSLGRLCDALAIPLSNRHRAGGDADATAILFQKLLEWDREGVVDAMLRKTSPEQRLPPNLPIEEFESLPDVTGVYYFHNQAGKVIYVGKAVNIKKRVTSHFTGHEINLRRQRFLKEIYHISYEVCGTELMALLLECSEIQRLWPVYNRALKRFEPRFGLFNYQGQDGYEYLAVGRMTKHQPCVRAFYSEYEAASALRLICQENDIDYRFCRFGYSRQATACLAEPQSRPDREAHNHRVAEALSQYLDAQQSYYILDRGRTHDEYGIVWVSKGQFYGMGYLSKECQWQDPEDIQSSLTRYPDNFYMTYLVTQYAACHSEKLITL